MKEELQKVKNARAVDSLHTTATKMGVSADKLTKLSERKRLYGHYGKVYAMAWAGDSEQVVSARYVCRLQLKTSRSHFMASMAGKPRHSLRTTYTAVKMVN